MSTPTLNEALLAQALYDLLEWAVGKRGSKSGNPYLVPEVEEAHRTLAVVIGETEENWIDVKEVYEAQRGAK
jgi:hypothetical protein